MLSHLQRLEAESIHIMREAVAESERPVMLYSIGKDSSVMLRLAQKAFHPARLPFPLMHIDTTWKFREMITFRDRIATELGIDLIVHINPDAQARGINPFDHGSALHTDLWKTEGLKQALDLHRFDMAFGGARRDEEKSRAKERVFYFNGAGRRSHLRPDLSGSTHLRYLGCRIDFRGVVGLSDDKCEEVLLDVTRRIRRTAALCLGRTTAERAGLLSYVANAALDPSAPGANKWSAALRGAVTDRGQLETLDRSIARILAEVLSGRTGCRAFRYIPYRDLRRSYGLRSLVVGRNGRGGRSRSGGMR